MGDDLDVETSLEEQEVSQLRGGLKLTICSQTGEMVMETEGKVVTSKPWKEAGYKKQMKRKNLVMATRQS
jgi:hypothetical protein